MVYDNTKNGLQTIMIDNIKVDIKALMSIGHDCRPKVCSGSPNCCSRYRIHVSEQEMETIVGFIPLTAKYTASVGDASSFTNVFEEEQDGSLVIDADENEQCVFAYTAESQEILCALHTAALDLGMSPFEVKPKCCTIWPLTLTDEPVPTLSVDNHFESFPCNRKKTAAQGIDSGIKETIRVYFGDTFLDELLEKLQT